MRFYLALLRLYPASFRAEYGREMCAIFRARRSETSGAFATLMFCLDVIGEVVVNAAGAHWDILRQDLRYTVRSLLRTPGFTLTAVLVTALGVGANTAAFSIADFVLVRPLPYADADRLVKLWEGTPGGGTNEVSPELYRQWKSASRSFAAMGAFYGDAVNMVGEGEPQRLERTAVTAGLLPILGIAPIRGRLFSPADEREGASGPLILSYALWQAQFNGDEAVIGRRLLINGSPRVVIGVMPPDFHYPSRDVALWTPISTEQQSDDDIGNTYWSVLARLRPGVTSRQANAEMNLIQARIAEQHAADLDGVGVATIALRDELSSQSRLLLLALCGAAACVLLIACANLANLLLARALTRRRELLVRSALGAGRERIVRQSITESLVLAMLGGGLGVIVAITALPMLARLVPTRLPIGETPSLDPRILLVAGLLTVVTGIGFGVLPAWRASGEVDLSGIRDGARAGGGRRARARSALVVVEVMASVVLLISAGLLMRALLRLQDTNPGFRTANVLTLRTALPVPRYDSTARRAVFYRDVLTEIRAIPGVSSAAYISGVPMAMSGGIWPVVPEGQASPERRPRGASSRFITPGFFAALDIPIKRGRDVTDTDTRDQPYVAVVSESFAQRYWPNEDPIGKRFKFLSDTRTVVGVVGDVRVRGPERPSEPQVYQSAQQVADGQSGFFYPKDLVVRSSIPASVLVPAIRDIVRRVDPQQPVSNIRMLADVVGEATAARAVQVRVLAAFAAIAFLLAGIGIHGLLSYAVSSRQHEIGVRMALGAQRNEIVRMIVRGGLLLAAAGLVPGLALAYLAARAMQSLLAGIEPGDIATFGAAAVLCVLMTLVGSLLPTIRAIRVDPATALRAET